MCEVLFLYPNGEDNKKQKKDPNYVSFQGNLFKHGHIRTTSINDRIRWSILRVGSGMLYLRNEKGI